MKSYFETENYDEFLAELHSVTSIDSRILDNLIKLDLIVSIFTNKESLKISKNSFLIYSDLSLKDYYLTTPQYIFASYPIHNPDFSVFPFDEKEHSYVFQKSLINYNSNDPIIIVFNTYNVDFTKDQSNIYFITVSFNVNFNLFFQNDINKLNLNDQQQCKQYIQSLLQSYVSFPYSGFDEFTLNSKEFLFLNSSIQLLLLIFNHENLDDFLTKCLYKYFKLFNLIEHEEKEGIKILFEKSLIKKEINNF